MTIFSFYCPACGESSSTEPDTYELAPGTETRQCPVCLTRFVVQVEYIPLDDDVGSKSHIPTCPICHFAVGICECPDRVNGKE